MPQMDYIRQVCRIGQGSACCKYLVLGHQGFQCMKVDEYGKALIDRNWINSFHVAQGDNCEGKDPIPQEIEKQPV